MGMRRRKSSNQSKDKYKKNYYIAFHLQAGRSISLKSNKNILFLKNEI